MFLSEREGQENARTGSHVDTYIYIPDPIYPTNHHFLIERTKLRLIQMSPNMKLDQINKVIILLHY